MASLTVGRRLLHSNRRLGQHFLVLGYDGTDSEALNRRNAVRAGHITRAQAVDFSCSLPMFLPPTRRISQAAKDAGQLLTAAAMINECGDMCGSALTMDFPDRAALNRWLKDEPYVTGGVWKEIKVAPVKFAPLK